MRARELARFERPKGTGTAPDRLLVIRAVLLARVVACLVTGHLVAWPVQFVLTLWFNTFLVVSSHDFEDDRSEEEELAAIPGPLARRLGGPRRSASATT